MLRGHGRTSCFYGCILLFVRFIHNNSNSLFRHIRARNGTTIMWVLNYEEELVEVKNLYGDNLMGVMTDRPTMLNTYC